jgi:PadR family transcriptional regulator AphA
MAMVAAPRLTTTSFAVLGLLSIRGWSTYELAVQMRRSLQHFWPRAASGIYEEPKKLVRAGYALAEASAAGRRARTVYRITDEGRVALRVWLEAAGDTPTTRSAAGRAYESEPLVRVFFGNLATKASLLAAIDQVGASARGALATWLEVAGPYAEGRGRFPERLPVNALVMRLAFDIQMAEVAWAEWARSEVEGWPDPSGPADDEHLRAVLSERLARIAPGPGRG